jgi:hypothetical protein
VNDRRVDLRPLLRLLVGVCGLDLGGGGAPVCARFVGAADRERGRVGVQPGQRDTEGASRPQREAGEQRGHIMGIQPIQRASQTVVVEIRRADPRSQQMLHRFVLEELRQQIQLAIAEPQAIEDHRHRRSPHRHLLA